MNFWNTFAALFSNFGALTWQMVVMWGIGALLIYLAIVKKMEPSLLLPMGFGAILVNLPASGAITQGDTVGPISSVFEGRPFLWGPMTRHHIFLLKVHLNPI